MRICGCVDAICWMAMVSGYRKLSSSAHRKPVVIVGGGIGGLVAALAVQRAGLAQQIYERESRVAGRKVGIALWGNAVNVLDRLTIGTKLRTRGLPTLEGQITDSADGKVLYHLNLLEETGGLIPEVIVVEKSELRQVILEELPMHSVHFETEMTNFVQYEDHVEVQFRNREPVDAAILIGADGVRSEVKSKLGIQTAKKYAGYSTWRGVVDLPSDAVDFPVHLGREIWGPGRRFGTMLMTPDRIYWYAVANARPGEVFHRPFKKKLLERFDAWPFRTGELIDLTTERDIIRHDVQERLMPLSWVKHRIALVGDAAHPITPNMHQGTCVAIEDAYSLAQKLAEYGVRDSLALEMYEKERRQHRVEVARRSWLIGKFAQWEDPWLCWWRTKLLRHPNLASSLVKATKLAFDYQAGDLPGPFLRG